MKKITLSTLLTTIYTIIIFGQDIKKNSQDTKSFWESDDFNSDLTVAIVTAILSFISAYLLYAWQKKREKKKQLSYDLKITQELIEIGKDIKEHIKITYKDLPTKNLSIIDFTLQNTGNMVVKNQNIRFSLESDAKFIDRYFEPKPEPEWKVEEIDQVPNLLLDRKIRIGQLEIGQKLSLKFIVSGADVKIKIVPHNDDGDVEFNPRSITTKQDEADTLNRFFNLVFILVVLNVILGGINIDFLNQQPFTIQSVVTLIILAIGLSDILKGIKIISDKFLYKEDAQVTFKDAKNVIMHSSLDISGDAHIGDANSFIPNDVS